MLSFFKKDKGKTNKARGLSFYDRENLVHKLSDLVTILNPESTQIFTTPEIIKYRGIPLSEITESSIIKLYDEPDFVIDKFDTIEDYKVMFYRHTVAKFTFLMQFHFYKGNFFFLSNMVTATGILMDNDKKTIIGRIANKYFPDLQIDSAKGFEMKLNDNVNNFISVFDGVNLWVNYINNSPHNIQVLNNSDLSGEPSTENFDSTIDDYF